MYVKLFSGDLNSDLCLLHPTSIYTCGVTTAPRVCGGTFFFLFFSIEKPKEYVTKIFP